VVLSAPPSKRGGSNRNYQIVSTSAGIRQARELGVRTVIKTRTDICLMAPCLFSLFRLVEPRVDRRQVEGRGLAGRIFVPQTYTKKYFPYHVSDIVMLGHLADLAAFWDVPLDERELAPDDFSWGGNSLERIGEEALLPECYLGKHYAERLSIAAEPDALSAYWRMLRDFFVIVDDGWFDMYWLKRPQPLQPRAVDELVSHHFWQTLYFGLTPPAAVWNADLSVARSEGASFSFREPPRISGATSAKR
jgi:hypothetical protein